MYKDLKTLHPGGIQTRDLVKKDSLVLEKNAQSLN
jgi:hypothetical protein